ncbi:mce associated protein mas1a [Mycolicibacterium peregrinum]|uniref:Mce associated protein mas1a n=1 Tax=Mycolicibacterium peregrinum TaxID=43304 RepID=A0A4Z0HX00_MYCPR|nr:mce associated protein mas1a [Mycolicibacterium peregrinum]TGB44742.1 mce associated protein mas1a [Mycolicibacterium peregrinum]TGB46847.1 mce associated protein mas1a [Mycolicibacterium peregrinum]
MSNSDDDSGEDDRKESVLTLDKPSDEVPENVSEDVADDVQEPDVVETGSEDSEPTAPSRLKRRIATGLVALLAVAAVAALVVLSLGEYHHRRDDALRTEAVAMSRDYLVAMAAFDYQKMDANREHIVANSTPGFAAKYDEMVKALRDIVVTSKGVATATADHVVVDTVEGNAATVVAFVDQHVTNVTAPQGSNQKYRMVVKLVRSGDRWIVDDVQTV